jgi:cyclohexanone monooxygenase
MMVSIEQHVDWIMDCLSDMETKERHSIEPAESAQATWVEHVQVVANSTLFPQGGSWYLGANIPGKPRLFMPYAAGVGPYREICDSVAREDYRGFDFA